MNSALDDLGVITAFLAHLEGEAIPWTLAVQAEIEAGAKLSDPDLLFFEERLDEMASLLHVIERHPEFQVVVGKMVTLYHRIIERALENQLQDDDSQRFQGLLCKMREWQQAKGHFESFD